HLAHQLIQSSNSIRRLSELKPWRHCLSCRLASVSPLSSAQSARKAISACYGGTDQGLINPAPCFGFKLHHPPPPLEATRLLTRLTRNSSIGPEGRPAHKSSRRFSDLRYRGELFHFFFQRMTLGDDLVHEPERPGILRRHEVITVERLVDGLVVLTGMADIDLIQAPLHLDDVLGVTLDVARLTLETARRLVQQNARVRQRVAHTLLAG